MDTVNGSAYKVIGFLGVLQLKEPTQLEKSISSQ